MVNFLDPNIINYMKQRIIFTTEIAKATDSILKEFNYDRLFIITDQNTHKYALPLLKGSEMCASATEIIIEADDTNKNIEAMIKIWCELGAGGATRKSMVVNLGGGMVTDIGGFAAATFKRGIDHINIPTTLLGAVDAAVGGKTGINFGGLKNEIGSFKNPHGVVICTKFFETLEREHLLSGYAEMLKHGLISNADCYNRLLAYDISNYNSETLLPLLEESVGVKEQIVEEDPTEKGVRKYLNLGHTAGHAIESLAMKRNTLVQHGYAVAWGLAIEAILSHIKLGFTEKSVRELSTYILGNYGAFPISCDDYPYLYDKMKHDKKNEGDSINFTLLKDVGDVAINVDSSRVDIEMALDLYRDLFKL